MDFMTDLPNSQGNRYLWVIKDRLSKWVVLEAMPDMKAEGCAAKFMDCWLDTTDCLKQLQATEARTGRAPSGKSCVDYGA